MSRDGNGVFHWELQSPFLLLRSDFHLAGDETSKLSNRAVHVLLPYGTAARLGGVCSATCNPNAAAKSEPFATSSSCV